MFGSDDRDGDVERAGGGQRPAHGGDVGLDRAGPRDDRSGSVERGAERRTVERHFLADPADVANRPTALGGCDVRAGAAVADGQVRRLTRALREPVEVGLCGRDQPIERRAAPQPCRESQRRRPGGEVPVRIAIDIPASLQRSEIPQRRGRREPGRVGGGGQVAAAPCQHDLEQVEHTSDRPGDVDLVEDAWLGGRGDGHGRDVS